MSILKLAARVRIYHDNVDLYLVQVSSATHVGSWTTVATVTNLKRAHAEADRILIECRDAQAFKPSVIQEWMV